MTSIREMIRQRFSKHQPLAPGMYPYQSPADAAQTYRLQLRIEANGQGILILNASTVLHLNQTAAEFAYYFIKSTPNDEVARLVADRYKIKKPAALEDYVNFTEKLQNLAQTVDLDPELFLDTQRQEPYSGELSAPYRLDCALTYQIPDNSMERVTPQDRVKRELTTEEWQIILDKAWRAGIPHIIFTGGEPTIRPDLKDLIAYAEKLGQVTGLLTNGWRLSESEFLHSILNSGLDHIMLVLDSEEEYAWEAVRDILHEDISLTVHLTVTPHNQAEAEAVLQRLVKMGVKNVSLSASVSSLNNTLQSLRQTLAQEQIRLVWDLPVPYSPQNPVAVEQGLLELPQGAGSAWLYLEPDGDVLLAQGHPQTIGNLLTDSWESIWSARPSH